MEGGREDNGNILRGEDKLHPLLQPPVLEVLFPMLSLEDIANCRLVCKVWRMESLSSSSWRTNVTLKFTEEGIVNDWENPTSTTSLAQFNDFWVAECATKPFKQFHISGWRFKFEDVDQSTFLKLVGEHVTSLTLSSSSLGGERFEYVRKLLFQTFPKLECLKMDNCIFTTEKELHLPDDWWSFSIPPSKEPTFGAHRLKSLHLTKCRPVGFSVTEMMSNFPMLNSLHMDFGSYSVCEPIRKLLNTIKVIRAEDQTKLPIKDLDIGKIHLKLEAENQAMGMEILNLLGELNIPLLRLVISLDRQSEPEEIHEEIIRDILGQHHSTLKFLSGTAHLYLEPPDMEFPFGLEFENLEEVEIHEGFCDNLNWLKYTPNLQSLYIKMMDGSNCHGDDLVYNSSELKIGNWTLPSLKILRFEVRMSTNNMRKFMKWMPNVETLVIVLDDDIFCLVCEHWKMLKSLTDFWGGLTDKGVIGGIAAGDEVTQIAPNIAQLKCLTYFETPSQAITARSVYEGFLKMPSLTTVICPFLKPRDAEAIEALKRQGITFHRYRPYR